MERQYHLYCDGSCLGNPGPGGWAYRVWQGRRVMREQSGTEQNTTDNRMELRAGLTRAVPFFHPNPPCVYARRPLFPQEITT